jgi:hypothetical protein
MKAFLRFAIAIFVLSGCLSAQTLIFDRGISNDTNISLGWTEDNQHFIGDEFIVGTKGEVWIIDKIRTWAVVENKDGLSIEDLFKKIELFGSLAEDALPNPDAATCACHDAIILKAANLREKFTDNSDVQISPSPGLKLWQIDFNNMRWSVPGGAKLQFGINAILRTPSEQNSAYFWLNSASTLPAKRPLRIFTQSGKLELLRGYPAAINIQVWGHPSKH